MGNIKKVLVYDSHNSDQITKILQELYKGRASVHSIEEVGTGIKFDLFFLSGTYILEKKIKTVSLKESKGNPTAKVVAMSVSDNFLREINETVAGVGVDFTHNKCELVDNQKAEDLSEREKEKLRGYLLA